MEQICRVGIGVESHAGWLQSANTLVGQADKNTDAHTDY